ncbi:MAG: geranylgeranylglyceryl/heptaprenylglyceryl phosphate synthase [Candidatus Cloacimonetes bacterium]|nr:geranylgeranylglyceryl/heptaprenylglyceryl phosphate synthase [Candidatus Cloacimonadota bacterium]
MKVYDKLIKLAKHQASYFCLLDPDKIDKQQARKHATACEVNGADGILVGGSLMLNNNFDENLKAIKESVSIPVIIFPGIFNFVSPHADALLLLSVVTSRNPQMLIGEQVRAAPLIRYYKLEAIGTAYMLIESGNNTSVHYMSGSFPIPRTKNDIAIAHALASEYLGFKLLYLDAGSGAQYSIPDTMIREIKKNVSLPLVVGGGIKTPEEAAEKANAGADFIVTGDILEKQWDVQLIKDIAAAVHSVKR